MNAFMLFFKNPYGTKLLGTLKTYSMLKSASDGSLNVNSKALKQSAVHTEINGEKKTLRAIHSEKRMIEVFIESESVKIKCIIFSLRFILVDILYVPYLIDKEYLLEYKIGYIFSCS